MIIFLTYYYDNTMTNINKIIELLDIQNIIDKLSELEKKEMIEKLSSLTSSVFPFSDYEFIISNLLWQWKMSLYVKDSNFNFNNILALRELRIQKYVVYRNLYGDLSLSMRLLEIFLSEIDHEKYSNIEQKYRFEFQKIRSVAQ